MIRHALAPVLVPAARSLDLPGRLSPAAGGVAITFDDGPHPEGTPAILNVLAQAGATATFFMIGEQVRRRPALAAEVAAAGHRIALHGFRHRLQLRLPRRALAEDLSRGWEALTVATGVEPHLHRPPFGIYSSVGLGLTREAGLRPLLWSRWGKDWRRLTHPERIAARATRRITAGEVILLHDADFYSAPGSHRRTEQALRLILAELNRRRLATVLPV